MTDKEQLSKLRAAIGSPTTPEAFKEKLQKAIDVLEKKISDSEKEVPKKTSSKEKKAKLQKLIDDLIDGESDIWDDLKADSGSMIRSSDVKLSAYAKAHENLVKKLGIGKNSLSEKVFDKLTAENQHLSAQFLYLNNYFEPNVKTTYEGGNYPHENTILKIRAHKVSPVSSTYTARHDIESVTIDEDGETVTYKVSDFLDGAHKYKKGGRLSDDHEYIPIRNVISLNTKEGRSMKPSNGIWIKKSAMPIRESKFARGGRLKSALMRDRKYVNKSQKHETDYSKGKNRPSYFEKGGILDEKLFQKHFSLAKKQLLADIRTGLVPKGIKSFDDLNDYVDANYYGGFIEEDYELSEDFVLENKVQKSLDTWIKSADFKKNVQEISVRKPKKENYKGNAIFTKAKEIRKPGEDWQEALSRARLMV